MQKHDQNLERIIKDLSLIDEDVMDVKFIMKEGIYLQDNSTFYKKMCDLLIGFYNEEGLCLELKRGESQSNKAILQLTSGRRLMRDTFGYDIVRGKIAYYGSGRIKYEEIIW